MKGWQINHYDLSTRYAGVLVSITSAFGTLGAIIVPMVTGECTKDRVRGVLEYASPCNHFVTMYSSRKI